MKQKYKIIYTDDREDETIECDGMKQTDDTVVFMSQTTVVAPNGAVGVEVFLICHWSDIREIRKVELTKGAPAGGAPKIALAT